MPQERVDRLHFENGLQEYYEASLIGEGSLSLLENWVPDPTGALRCRRGWRTTPAISGLTTDVRGIGHLGLNELIEPFQTPVLRQNTLVKPSLTATFSSSSVAGNLLIAIIAVYATGGAPTITTPTGWTAGPTQTTPGSQGRLALFYREEAPATSTLTIALGGVPDIARSMMMEFSGLALSGAADRNATDSGTGTILSSGTTAATTQVKEVAIAAVMAEGGTGLDPFTNGFSDIARVSAALASVLVGYKGLDATGAVVTESDTAGASQDWAGVVQTFKAAPAIGQAGRYVVAHRKSDTEYSIYQQDSRSPAASSFALIEDIDASTGTAPTTTRPVAFATGLEGILYTSPDLAAGEVKFWDGDTAVALADAPTGRAATFHKERFWIGGTTDKQSRVYYSDLGDATGWDTTDGTGNYIDVNPDDGEPIEDLLPVEDGLLIAKRSSLWFLTGTGLSSFTLHAINQGGGYVGRSLCSIPEGAIIAQERQVWLWSGGTSVELISRPIEANYGIGGTFVSTAYVNGTVHICDEGTGTVWVFELETGAWHQQKITSSASSDQAPAFIFAHENRLLMGSKNDAANNVLMRFRDHPKGGRVRDEGLTETFKAHTGELWLAGPERTVSQVKLYLQLRQRGGDETDAGLIITPVVDGTDGTSQTITPRSAAGVFRSGMLRFAASRNSSIKFKFEQTHTVNDEALMDIEQATLVYLYEKMVS